MRSFLIVTNSQYSSRLLKCLTGAVVTIGLIACGLGDTATQSGGNPTTPIQDLLSERSASLRDGDLEGYLRSLEPAAREFERPIAQRALEMPLAGLDLVLDDATISDDGQRFSNALIVFVFRYEGLPEDNVFRFYLRHEIEKRPQGWVVTQSRLDPNPLAPRPPLWVTGPVKVDLSEHFMALSRPDLGPTDAYLEAAEGARAGLVGKLALEPDSRHLAVMVAGESSFDEYLGSPDSGAVAAASYDLRATSAHPERPENREMVIDVEAVFSTGAAAGHEGRPQVSPREVLEHEIAHLVLSRFTRRVTPAWVVEGAAMFLAGASSRDQWLTLVGHDLLERTTLSNMAIGDNMGVLDYAYAQAAVLYLVEYAGGETFFDFYQNFKDLTGLDAPEVRSTGAERLLRRYYRFGVDELDGFTRDQVRRAASGILTGTDSAT